MDNKSSVENITLIKDNFLLLNFFSYSSEVKYDFLLNSLYSSSLINTFNFEMVKYISSLTDIVGFTGKEFTLNMKKRCNGNTK